MNIGKHISVKIYVLSECKNYYSILCAVEFNHILLIVSTYFQRASTGDASNRAPTQNAALEHMNSQNQPLKDEFSCVLTLLFFCCDAVNRAPLCLDFTVCSCYFMLHLW